MFVLYLFVDKPYNLDDPFIHFITYTTYIHSAYKVNGFAISDCYMYNEALIRTCTWHDLLSLCI